MTLNGVQFQLGSAGRGAKNVLVPGGERIALPAGFTRLYVVAAAVGGDVPATIQLGGAAVPASRTFTVAEWQGPIGQWDSRLKSPSALREPFVPASAGRGGTPSRQEIQDGLVVRWDPATGEVSGIDQIRPGFAKRDEIAWVGTHRHAPNGNQIYVPSYLFVYALDLPDGVTELTLPSNAKIRIMAMTAVREPRGVRPAAPLYAADLPQPKR